MGSKKGSRRASAPDRPALPITTDAAPTSAKKWKRTLPEENLLLPSGNIARVKRVGPEAFLAQGIMPDALAPIVQKSINDKRGLPPKVMASMIKDKKSMGQIVEMMDRVVCYAVIEPTVSMPEPCQDCGEILNSANEEKHGPNQGQHKYVQAPRDPEKLYVTDVDLEDKQFIMNFCVGGSRDLERFREQQRESVGRLDAEPGVEGAAV